MGDGGEKSGRAVHAGWIVALVIGAASIGVNVWTLVVSRDNSRKLAQTEAFTSLEERRLEAYAAELDEYARVIWAHREAASLTYYALTFEWTPERYDRFVALGSAMFERRGELYRSGMNAMLVGVDDVALAAEVAAKWATRVHYRAEVLHAAVAAAPDHLPTWDIQQQFDNDLNELEMAASCLVRAYALDLGIRPRLLYPSTPDTTNAGSTTSVVAVQPPDEGAYSCPRDSPGSL